MTLIKLAIIIIEYSFLLIKNAVDAGVINNATTRIIPTVWILATVTNESNNITK